MLIASCFTALSLAPGCGCLRSLVWLVLFWKKGLILLSLVRILVGTGKRENINTKRKHNALLQYKKGHLW